MAYQKMPQGVIDQIEGDANSFHFSFDDTGDISGTVVNDESVNSHNGTTYLTGHSIDDGVSVPNLGSRPHYLKTTSSASIRSKASLSVARDTFSLNFWAYNLAGQTSFGYLVSLYASDAQLWYLRLPSAGNLDLAYFDSGSTFRTLGPFSISSHTGWNMYTLVVDNITPSIKLYANGSLLGSHSYAFNAQEGNSGILSIFSYNVTAYPALQEMSFLSDYLLNTTEISNLYNSGDGTGWNGPAGATEETVTDSITFSDTLAWEAIRRLSDSITLSDVVSTSVIKPVSGTLSFEDGVLFDHIRQSTATDSFTFSDTAEHEPIAGIQIQSCADGFDHYGSGDVSSVITDSIYWNAATNAIVTDGVLDLTSGSLVSNPVAYNAPIRFKVIQNLTGLAATKIFELTVNGSETIGIWVEEDGFYLTHGTSTYKDRLFVLEGSAFYLAYNVTNSTLYINGRKYVSLPTLSLVILSVGAFTLQNTLFDDVIIGSAYTGDTGIAALRVLTYSPTSSNVLTGTPSTGTILGTLTDSDFDTYTTLNTNQTVTFFQPSRPSSSVLKDIRLLFHDEDPSSQHWTGVGDFQQANYGIVHKQAGWISMSCLGIGLEIGNPSAAFGIKSRVDSKRVNEFVFQYVITAPITTELSVSDSFSLTDKVSRTHDRSLSDSLTLSEAIELELEDFQKQETSVLTLVDSLSFNYVKSTTLSDSLTFTDSVARLLDTESVSSSFTFSDSVSSSSIPQNEVNGILDLVDGVDFILDAAVATTDILIFQDNVQTQYLGVTKAPDSFVLADTVTTTNFEAKHPTDVLSISDTVTVRNLPYQNISDNLGLTDSVVSSSHEAFAVVNNLSFFDTTVVRKIGYQDLTDTLSFSDIASPASIMSYEICDYISFSDKGQRVISVTLTDTLDFAPDFGPKAVDDELDLIDVLTSNAVERQCVLGGGYHVLTKALTDSFVFADVVSDTQNLNITVTDSIGLRDSAFRVVI